MIDQQFGPKALVVSKRAYSEEAMVIKLATLFPDEAGRTSLSGAMLLIDRESGKIRTFFADEALLTNHRTAAAGALASIKLYKEQSHNLLIVGSGTQAKLQAIYHAQALPIEQITFTARSPDSMVRLIEQLGLDLPQIKFAAVPLDASSELAQVTSRADIIVTTTASTTAIIRSEWVQPGTHISAIGSDRPGKRELDPMLIRRSKYYYDDLAQCHAKGEVQGVKIEELKANSFAAFLNGDAPGRETPEEITIFDSTGVGHQDLAIALLIEEKSKT